MFRWIAFACLASLAAAQNQASFQTSSRLVLIDVIVRNDQGPVRGLSQEDFILEDKGKKQEITVFDTTEIGKSDVPPVPLTPGIATNRLNSKGEFQETATVILYDKINSIAGDQAFVRQQVLRLIASLKDTDRVGFYSLGFQLQVVHDYNEEAAPLVRAAKKMLESNASPDGLSPADQALYKALDAGLTPMQGLTKQARVNITYPAFRMIARHLAGVPGRRNVMWITSAFPLTYGDSPERRRNDQMEVDAFGATLTEGNISLYPVDPGGSGSALGRNPTSVREGGVTGIDNAPAREGSLMPNSMVTNTDNSLTGNQAMLLFADKSGGKAYRNMNDIEPALREVMQTAEYTYTLGFRPDEKTLDGKVHKLEVKLAKKPQTDKARVLHRKEYVAWGQKNPPDPTLAPKLPDLLADSLPAGAIGLMAVSNPDPAKPGFQQMIVRVTVPDVQFTAVGEKYVGQLEMALALEGQNTFATDKFDLNLSQDDFIKITQGGLDLAKSVETGNASGRFHVVIQDKATGAAGSLWIPFAPAPPK